MSANSKGFIDGLTDAREDRTPEHSLSAYKFPLAAPVAEQEAYNLGYYEAKRAYAAASALEIKFRAREAALHSPAGWVEI